MNLNLTLSKIVEEGRTLTKLYGPGFTGLENLGNSCYMASVIQVLFSLEHFQAIYYDMALEHLNTCLNNPVDCYYCQICKLIYGLLSGMYSQKKTKILPKIDDKPEEVEEYQDGVRPASFKNFFHKGHKEFSSGRQQDALEYLGYILEKFERQEKMNGMPNPKSPFEFEIESRMECENCHIVKYRKITSYLLNLTIPNWETKKEKGSKVTLEECIAKYLASERVELECPNCKKNSTFIKTQKINQYPAYLIIVFERFVYDWVAIKLDVDFVLPSEDVNFNSLTRIHSKNNENVIVEEVKNEDEEVEVEPEFNQSSLSELLMNGIPELAAKHSLLNTGNNSAEDAINWYFMNMESAEINQPIKKIKKQKNVQAQIKPNVNQALVKDLMEMGFPQKRAEFALGKCNNDMERACDYLFSHMEDEDEIALSNNNSGGNLNANLISKYTDTTKNTSIYKLYGSIYLN
jgi:ubiquitin carboxyl-terminal hydrolase 5/13